MVYTSVAWPHLQTCGLLLWTRERVSLPKNSNYLLCFCTRYAFFKQTFVFSWQIFLQNANMNCKICLRTGSWSSGKRTTISPQLLVQTMAAHWLSCPKVRLCINIIMLEITSTTVSVHLRKRVHSYIFCLW